MKIILILMMSMSTLSTTGQVIKFKMKNANITENEIREVLAIYPKGLVETYLDTIDVTTDSRACGRAYIDKIMLNGDCSNDYLKEVIHHELSSVFLNHYDIYVSKVADEMMRKFIVWNGDEYAYNNKVDMSAVESSSEMGDYFYGLKYAQQGFENDFNVIAQYLFTRGRQVLNHINQRPGSAIDQKVREVISFYSRLDQKFNMTYFANIK